MTKTVRTAAVEPFQFFTVAQEAQEKVLRFVRAEPDNS